MNGHTQFVYPTGAVRELERRAAADHGLPSAELMRRAGNAAFEYLYERWPAARRIAVICGPGNNGGDGKVLAERAEGAGLEVTVIEVKAESGRFAPLPYGEFEVVVDALFGIGLSREPGGAIVEAIEAINASGSPVLSLDVPSGLNADSGETPGIAVTADATVTFLAYKRGLFTGLGPRQTGTPVLATLEVPNEAQRGFEPVASVLPHSLARRLLGRRKHDAHKGDHGHALVVGGNRGMAGAAHLAGFAALRSGAGLVSLAVAPGMGDRAAGGRSELMVHELADAESLDPLLERADVVIVGPGLGSDPWARRMAEHVFASGKPLVVDADALMMKPPRSTGHVLTPHPGEAARLLGITSNEVQRDRFVAHEQLVAKTGATVVLKGASTLVGGPGRLPQVCIAGNPGMAGAGMGDALAGVIGSLLAQGLDASDAAAAGVQKHAEAGDRAAHGGMHGMIATDLIEALRGSDR